MIGIPFHGEIMTEIIGLPHCFIVGAGYPTTSVCGVGFPDSFHFAHSSGKATLHTLVVG